MQGEQADSTKRSNAVAGPPPDSPLAPVMEGTASSATTSAALGGVIDDAPGMRDER
jgi:hypothetical protein